MYGRCQDHAGCTNSATHLVDFTHQPTDDPMKVCDQCVKKHRQDPRNDITKL